MCMYAGHVKKPRAVAVCASLLLQRAAFLRYNRMLEAPLFVFGEFESP